MIIAVYPGSFDPVTNGHLDIAKRAARLFDRVVMAVFDKPNKRLVFSSAERVALLREATAAEPRIEVATYASLTAEYVRSIGAHAIIRGLRATGDFEAEYQLAQINQTLAPEIESVFLMAGQKYAAFSSSMVRELASLGGDVSWLVPPHVALALQRVYTHRPAEGSG
ncbi:MAG TPA: pantetheine-phosphate adenylyltransferase [Roseiflexaceae bacterium]|nr:pantetheine-phosphate adenylyltransferase [Roseiflexaceae bacterium]HMP39033.1 pantetheine-phosphate adenylyltransferase [Roseiflexaceae bacterium]